MQLQSITTTVMPGYQVNEYLLVINLPAELSEKVKKVKETFAEKFDYDTGGKSVPHITLVNFFQYAMMEERLLNRLKVIAMGTTPFKIELQNYGNFPSHTIYINVTSKVPMQNLVKTIRQDAQRLMKLNQDNKPHFIMEPYLPIARQLKPWQYEKGWLEYQNKSFSGRMIAGSMTLLKKPLGEKYRRVQTFSFQNLPVSTKQGELFW